MMSSASKRRRSTSRLKKVNFPVCEGSQNGTVETNYEDQAPIDKCFGVRQDFKQVEVRVQYEGRDIGKFTHRIPSKEKSPWVKANFLVELIAHYGGRRPIKGGRVYQDMNLRSLHEVFQALPSKFPETLVEFLNKYNPDDKDRPVPKEYRKFIIKTYKDNKDEVLRLYESRVQPTTSHVVLDSCTDEMEIGENETEFSRQTISQQSEMETMKNLELENKELKRIIDLENNRIMELDNIIADLQAQLSNTVNNRIMELENIIADLQGQLSNTVNNRIMELENIIADLQAQLHERNKTCTNHGAISKDIQAPWLEHIDKWLSEQPLITREDANRVPSEVPDAEEENWINYLS